MRAKLVCFLAAVVLFIPCVCVAQTESATVSSADIEPFVGSWTGQYRECTGPADCESRKIDMAVTTDTVSYTLGPGEGGFNRHTKASSGPSSKSYPARYEKVKGVITLSFTQSSGMVISFTRSGDKLMGQGSSTRFDETYTLTKTGR
jgi:hypothetical protein